MKIKKHVIGWDIGGAHVKVAVLNTDGQAIKLGLYPCPLWQGLEQLSATLHSVKKDIPWQDCHHVVTMTGELADIFINRKHGIAQILAATTLVLGQSFWVYAGLRGFVIGTDGSNQDPRDIASMNWLASAQVAALQLKDGLFVDIGSTTTDVLLLRSGKVDAVGMTDYHRLISKELVYTGIVRTPVMALAQQALFKGQIMGLMAENFATMADVYRLTGDLYEAYDCYATADGGPKTLQASALRLSRITGYEFAEQELEIWLDFAQTLKNMQKEMVCTACSQQLSRLEHDITVTFIGAGIGRFLVKEIAEEKGCRYIDFNDLIPHTSNTAELNVADCAPAVAVGRLFYEALVNKR